MPENRRSGWQRSRCPDASAPRKSMVPGLKLPHLHGRTRLQSSRRHPDRPRRKSRRHHQRALRPIRTQLGVSRYGAARNSSGGCREQHEVCCSWWSFPGLASFALSRMVRRRLGGCRCLLRSRLSCRRSSAAPCTRRRTGSALAGAMRAPAGAIPTGEAKDLYVFPLRRDVGCGIVRRFLWRGSCGRRWSAQELRSIYQRRFPACAGAPHRLGAVRDGAACEPARRRTTTQKELEQHERTGTSRSPPCTGCCRTPTRDGSRMRRAAAGRQRGRRQAHRRGSLRDSLAGRYSILNYHDGEIAAVHAATALAVCSPSTRSTPPARLIIETHRAD